MHSLIWRIYHKRQSKRRHRTQWIRIFLLSLGIFLVCLVSLLDADSEKAPITVDGRSGNPSAAAFTEVNAALNKARDGDRILLRPGTHVVDNPLMLRKSGLQLIGEGRAETIVRPRNAGRPIFVLEAPKIGLRDLTIDARVPGGSGRATIAIYIAEEANGSEVVGTRILGTGASAVLCPSASDLMVVDNEILDAGDDAIRLHGEGLNISGNFIQRYYDEAIDVTGNNVTISDNYVHMGRVGITLGESRDGVIRGNTVRDHYHGGIFFASSGGGIVSDNHVIDAETVAFSLRSAVLVASNRVEGRNELGFNIIDMANGTVQQNIVADADVGWSLKRSSRNLIIANRLCGGWEPWRRDEQSIINRLQDNQFEINCDLRNEWKGIPVNRTAIPHLVHETQKGVLLGNRYSGSMDITGVSAQDRNTAERVAKLLVKNNPGFISIHVDGDSMRSLITPELSQTLSGAGQLAVGIVRMPFIFFSKSRRHRLREFPLWHLIEGDREVAVVAPILSGVSARIFVMQDRQLGRKNSAKLLALRLQRLWHYGSRELVQRRVRGIPYLVFLVAFFAVSALLLRRQRIVRRE